MVHVHCQIFTESTGEVTAYPDDYLFLLMETGQAAAADVFIFLLLFSLSQHDLQELGEKRVL